MNEDDYCEVDTRSGKVRGRWRRDADGASAAFLGIPYAQAPIGELRFAAPVPEKPWDGVRDALQYGPTPWRSQESSGVPDEVVPGDETLNVNVFTPRPGDESAALPVMVWIHGGGYYGGTPADTWYDGQSYNRDGVVTVSVSYRLGFDGFGWIEGVPANRGVLDWIAGLEWVQENIRAFGGDPARVTVAGQSAGGGAVLTLLGLEQAQHLFTGVHSISGAFGDLPRNVAQELGAALAKELGVAPTAAGLRTVSEERIYEVQQRLAAPPGMDYMKSMVEEGPLFAPVVDGDVIQRPTFESYALGIGADKALLFGTTDEEFLIMTVPMSEQFQKVPLPDLLASVGLSGSRATAYLTAHPEIVARGNAATLGKYLTDGIFRATILRALAARRNAPSWVYRFAFVSGATGLSNHCLDLPFWFDRLGTPEIENYTGANPPQELATAMHDASVRFIEGHNPGWPAWSDEPGVCQVFGGAQVTHVSTGDYDDAEVLLSQAFRRTGA